MSFKKFDTQDLDHDSNGQIIMQGGDVVVNSSDGRHVNVLLISTKGSFRFHPTAGIAIQRYLNAVGSTDEVVQDIQEGLTADGYEVKQIELDSNGQLIVNAKRTK